MPLITVTYATSRETPSLKAEIAAAVSELTARILRKDPKVTAIIVKAANAAELFAMPDVDGGLIGGASLKADEFAAICFAADR